MRYSLFAVGLAAPLVLAVAAVHAEDAPASRARGSFNPDVSLILSGSYAHLSNDPDGYAIPGFMLGAETGPGPRGLSLGESELVLSANVDDIFYGQFTAAVTPENEIEVEEAYVQAVGLAPGVTLRAGRFFSGIGYLNGQHPHAWDFADTALPYRAMLANQYGDDGVRLTWLAPTDLFIELGGEWLRGANFPAGGDANDGQGAASAFMHIGGDVGDSHAWRAGLSYLRALADQRLSGAIDTAPDAFSGESRVAIADLVWKWAPNGNPRERNFKFQAEYLKRDEDGELTCEDNSADGGACTGLSDAYTSAQSGWYAQGVYQFMPRWRVGYRYDRLDPGTPDYGVNNAAIEATDYHPYRHSVMADYSPSEYSRLRLQYTRDETMQDEADNVWILQYIMSLGAHGAHKF
jgi:hypothetical protein